MGEDSKKDVREDVQEFREIVLAVQVLSASQEIARRMSGRMFRSSGR